MTDKEMVATAATAAFVVGATAGAIAVVEDPRVARNAPAIVGAAFDEAVRQDPALADVLDREKALELAAGRG